ncbi:hypothetical protein QSH65_24875, partial [Escherichia coli]|nr:hypothetical protein [Escherichia coli]
HKMRFEAVQDGFFDILSVCCEFVAARSSVANCSACEAVLSVLGETGPAFSALHETREQIFRSLRTPEAVGLMIGTGIAGRV